VRNGPNMGGGPGHQMGPGDGTGPIHQMLDAGGGVWEWVLPLLFLGLLVAILVFLVLAWRNQRVAPATVGAPMPVTDPTRAAALRFARGEIDADEFDHLRDRLGGAGGGPAEDDE
jgi:uncharacterized membrane protein